MIPRKRLQLLLYILCIFYVFGEDDLNNLQRIERVNDATEISSIYTEHTTFEKNTDLYNEKSTKSNTDFPEETTEFTENELLTSDNSMDTSTDLLNLNVSVSDFTEDSTYVFSSSTEITYSESTSEIPGTEIPICDTTDEVQSLTVYSTDTEWLCLSWSLPCYTNESFIYLIDICSAEKCLQVNETNSQYNATDLDPCTEYTFTVKISDGISESNGNSITASTSFNITTIGEVQNLNINQTTTDVIQLIWDAPMIYPMCVNTYLITQCIESSCSETSVASTEYYAENLKPCKMYTFTVVSVAQITQSDGIDISGKLYTPRPGKPRFPIAEADPFSLDIHWQPPEIGAACIKHYRVSVDPHSDTLQPVHTHVTINGLYACTTYNIYINAVDEDNRDGEMVILQSETVAIVSKTPVLNIADPSISMNSIFLTWKIENMNSNCLVMSLIAICNYTASNGHGYEFINGEAETNINSPIVHDSLIINSTIENISPFTTYTCWAYTINKAGASEYSEPLNVTTLEDVPSAPLLNIASSIDSHFIFIWDMPEYLAGTLQDFEITLVCQPLFPIPDWCPRDSPSNIMHFNGSTFTYKYTESRGFTSYTARIRAKTTAGWGNYSEPLLFQSQPAVPGMVSNFTFVIKENENNTNILDTILMWALPCSLNGMIEYFNVSAHGIRNSYAPHSFSVEKYIIGSTNKNDMFSINLRELKGEYNYTFKVSAKVARVKSFGEAASYSNIIYPAGIPPQPEDEYIKSITIDPYKARRSTTSAAILLPLFSNSNGNIVYYSIIVSEMGYNPASNTRFKLSDNSWPNVSSWEESMLQDFTIPYQATRPHWDPYPNYVADYGHMKAVKYVIGDDTNCKEISSNTKNQVYCNGPLKPDTWYNVRMRAFTRDGYTDSIIFVVKTNAEINVGIVIGIVFGILFLGILTTMMLLVRKCSPQAVLRRFLHSDMPGSPVPAPFTRKKFIAHCQQLVDNPGKLSNEFRLLQTLSVDLQMPTNTACLQANRKKNRYSDILPYDFSRVKLEVIDNDPNTDYINASFIRGFTGEDEYIACQGPKEETTYDFWRMVDQYNVNIIIMLTQLIEKGKEKCHQYFPTIKETFRYENMTIRCTSELDYRTYTQRTLMLQKENKKRNIIHLHFKDWPDHDVPEDFDPMIHFCQIMRRNILANEGLIIIHCSAGIGRTGTLIAIDILLQHLRDNRKLDVFGTVYRLRHHRINMVQRESQYAYIYNCIKQVLKNPYCLKSYKPPPVNPVYENISKKEKTASNSNTNLVNNPETLKKRNFFVSMDSIRPFYDIFSWPSKKPQASAMSNGLRYCKSTSAINRKGHQFSLEEPDSLDCLFYEVLQNSAKEFDTGILQKDSKESTNLICENFNK